MDMGMGASGSKGCIKKRKNSWSPERSPRRADPADKIKGPKFSSSPRWSKEKADQMAAANATQGAPSMSKGS